MHTPSQLFFVPGAPGNSAFWRPAAGLLACPPLPNIGSTPDAVTVPNKKAH